MTFLFYLLSIAMLILFPEDTAQTALYALMLFGKSILPTLFPYMVLSKLLCRSLHQLNISPYTAVSVLGLLGGSPSGAALLVSSTDSLTEKHFFTLCALTGTVSPMFILGTLYTWTQQSRLCRCLLLCHWFGAILCAWFVNLFYHEHNQKIHTDVKTAVFMDNPLSQSIDAILHVGGYIILYSVIASMLGRILQKRFPIIIPILHAFLEISGGTHEIVHGTYPQIGILLCAILGFSGLSILSQNHAILRPAGIRMRQLVCFGLLRASFSVIMFFLLTMLLPISLA